MILLQLTVVLLVQAQGSLNVTPKMVKGDKRVYMIETTASVAGQGEVKTTVESQYTVVDVTPAGYELDLRNTSMEKNTDGGNLMSRIMNLTSEMMTGFSMRLSLDKDGHILKVLNYEEVRQKMEVYVDKAVDEIMELMPEVSQLMSKESIKEQTMAMGSEEALIKTLQSTANVLALSGKTLSNGMEESIVNVQGMKLKRKYTLDGKTVVSEGNLDMNKDDLKSFVIAQVERLAPAQASMIKDNIDMVMSSGLLKIEMSEKATYTLSDDLWVRSIESTTDSSLMGQKSSVSTRVTLKE